VEDTAYTERSTNYTHAVLNSKDQKEDTIQVFKLPYMQTVQRNR
jgi:hypothetical protein